MRGHVARVNTHESMTCLATNQFVDCYASRRSLKWRAVSLRYRTRAVITVLVREQKPYPVQFLYRRKSYSVYCEYSSTLYTLLCTHPLLHVRHSEVSLEWQVRVVTSKKTWGRLSLHELQPPARPTQVRGLVQRGGSTIILISLTNKENSRVCLQSG